MTEEEFIRQARLDWEGDAIFSIKDALEACYINGSYDDISGDVEAPTGHFYQIERWVVTTDTQGVVTVHTYETTEEAEKFFEELDKEYSEWSEDN